MRGEILPKRRKENGAAKGKKKITMDKTGVCSDRGNPDLAALFTAPGTFN